jgi:integrase
MPYKREGTSKWWITVQGVRRSSGTTDFEAAKALEAKLNHQGWLDTHMGIKPPRSWKEAVVMYLKESQHKASYDTIVQRLRWWDKHLCGVDDIRSISRDMIDKIICTNREVSPVAAPSNTTANKYAIVVGAVLTKACREWGWTDSSPKLRRYPEPDHRRVFLTVEDWTRLQKELPQHLLFPATFAIATGLRAGKVFGLEWSQIDLKRAVLSVSGNAIKRGNTIPLNRTAMGVLEAIRAGKTQHLTRVFTYDGDPLQDYGCAWYKARTRAGLAGFPWHGFRHTFASWLAMGGAPEMVIDQLCGWAEKDTRGIYTHLNVDNLRPYSEIIDSTLSAQTSEALLEKTG